MNSYSLFIQNIVCTYEGWPIYIYLCVCLREREGEREWSNSLIWTQARLICILTLNFQWWSAQNFQSLPNHNLVNIICTINKKLSQDILEECVLSLGEAPLIDNWHICVRTNISIWMWEYQGFYFVEYCQSHITLSWIWKLLWSIYVGAIYHSLDFLGLDNHQYLTSHHFPPSCR